MSPALRSRPLDHLWNERGRSEGAANTCVVAALLEQRRRSSPDDRIRLLREGDQRGVVTRCLGRKPINRGEIDPDVRARLQLRQRNTR